jgi:glycosyltransferase involved in cell wall biosynthesis
MRFTVTGRDNSGSVSKDGSVVNARGGTEMMKEGLLGRLDDQLLSQFNIICSRVREIDSNKKNILWLHDTFNDPEAQHLADEKSRAQFKKLVFVSNYQFQTYHLALGVPYNESVVLRNAIVPIQQHDKSSHGPLRLIYHTTPHRGLELLVPVFEALYKKYGDKIVLDVYSSFDIYGWPQRDEPYTALFNRCREHPGINYHGSVSNEEVREALVRSHIFAYPNIWPETSCIAAIEAMSAKCAVVCPNHAGLAETCSNFGLMYQFEEDTNMHANKFARLLDAVIADYWNEHHMAKLEFQKMYVDNFYSWDNRILEWTSLLQSL